MAKLFQLFTGLSPFSFPEKNPTMRLILVIKFVQHHQHLLHHQSSLFNITSISCIARSSLFSITSIPCITNQACSASPASPASPDHACSASPASHVLSISRLIQHPNCCGLAKRKRLNALCRCREPVENVQLWAPWTRASWNM